MRGLAASLLIFLARAAAAYAQSNFYLYAFTGSPGKNSKGDFIATVDLFPNSSTYGQIIGEAYLPFKGVEAHHVSLVKNGAVLAAGSYLDYYLKVDSVFFFDVGADAAKPRFIKSLKPPSGTVADTFVTTPDGGLLVSLMGSKNGGTPGRVARFNSSLDLVAEYSTRSEGRFQPKKFNPHGIAVSAALGVFVTGDYYEPRSALVPQAGGGPLRAPIKYRSTFRLWNLTTGELIQTFDGGKANQGGFMDAKFLGPRPLAISGSGKGSLFLLNVTARTFTKVWSVPREYAGAGTDVHAIYRNGTRALVTVFKTRVLFLLNLDNPAQPILLDTYRLPKGANPHAVVATPDGSTAAVTAYFVDRPNISKLRLPGDRMLRFFTLQADTIVRHPVLKTLDFRKRYQGQGGGNPHGLALKLVPSPPPAPGSSG